MAILFPRDGGVILDSASPFVEQVYRHVSPKLPSFDPVPIPNAGTEVKTFVRHSLVFPIIVRIHTEDGFTPEESEVFDAIINQHPRITQATGILRSARVKYGVLE